MKLPRRHFLRLAAGAVVPIVSRIARAQTYPTRTITLIVPFPPGGSTDVAARIAADHMSRTLGQQIVVQNVTGAGGTAGSTRAMRADPDGHTILMGQMGTHAASVALYPNLPYKPDVDFEPIGMVTAFPLIIAARRSFPPPDLREFVVLCESELRQAQPGACRRRLDLLHHLPAAQFDPRGEADAGAVRRRCAGDERAGRRSGRLHVRRYRHRRSAARARQDQGLCDCFAGAQSGHAQRAHHHRGRAAGVPGVGLERPVRPQGHAEANPRPAGRRARQGAR